MKNEDKVFGYKGAEITISSGVCFVCGKYHANYKWDVFHNVEADEIGYSEIRDNHVRVCDECSPNFKKGHPCGCGG